MPSNPVLSKEDKDIIKQKLQILCEQLWVKQGYKKTSIKTLCTQTEIAIGTFYSLFPTKEELFFATVKDIQTRLKENFLQTVLQGKDKDSLAAALKELVREFASKPFLYDVSSPDFKAFITKLPDTAMEEIRFESIDFFKEICKVADLQPKIEETKAFGILSALLSTVATRKTIEEMRDYFEVFDFMTDKLVAEIFD